MGNLEQTRSRGYHDISRRTSPFACSLGQRGRLFHFGFLSQDKRLFRQEYGLDSSNWSFRTVEEKPDDESLHQQAIRSHSKIKKTIPLYIGLANGFCGSFTTFSFFMSDVFLALSNQLAGSSSRNKGYSFEAGFAMLLVHVTGSISALSAGGHLALLTDKFMITLPFRLTRRFIDPAVLVCGIGCWLGSLFLCLWPPEDSWRGEALLPVIFSPVGCVLRFYVSKHLNSRVPSFPLGTFL